MESEAEAKRGFNTMSRKNSKLGAASISVKKRKPLSNLTNLVNPNSSILYKKPNNPTSKFLNPPLNSPNISDSSIGSSNFNITTRKSITDYEGTRKDAGLLHGFHLREKTEIGDRTVVPDSVALSFPPAKKTKDRGKAPIAAHVEKTKDREKAVIAPHVEKTKDTGTATISPHLEKTKDKGRGIIAPHVVRTKDKGKASDVAFKVFTGEKTRDKAKAVAGYVTNHDVLKIQSKGKDIALSSDNISLESVKDKGKKSDATLGLPSLAKTKDKGKIVVMPEDFLTVEKRKQKSKGVPFPFSCPPLPKSRPIWNGLNESGDSEPSEFHTDPHMMHKKKRRCLPRDQDTPECNLPADFVEKQRAYFKEVDEFELLEEEVSDNEK